MEKIKIKIKDNEVEIETGNMAKQANGAVLVKSGGTAVLATVSMGKDPLTEEERKYDMLPLTVDYRERTYAVGKIPGGFFKREGRPKEKETLVSRFIDRSIRPLFPRGFDHKIQVSVLVLSCDGENDTEIPALIGTSAALTISDIPFNGPIGAVRVGKLKDNFVINPRHSEQQTSGMDLIIVGGRDSIIMMELGADEEQEEDIIKAIEIGQGEFSGICEAQTELKNRVGKTKIEFHEKEYDREFVNKTKSALSDKIAGLFNLKDKSDINDKIDELKKEIRKKFITDFSEMDINSMFDNTLKNGIRQSILENKIRVDGRKKNDIRNISCSVGVLPRAHGSALFTRGQTQSLVAVTLGTPKERQVMEELEGEYKERFLFHYNFPGFATGEVRPERGTSRREIGHGALAKRAISAILPPEQEFPYTLRLVSEILESNGSSSMASVCGGSLALFDAGVPVKSNVAGIAMGLIKENDEYIILTDIAGLEDHFGDMDFKIAGTKKGITALQLDLKISGINVKLINEVFVQAKTARLTILDKMSEVIAEPRKELSSYAPKMIILQIPQTKIGELIGPGGKNIKRIIEETGTKIDIEDSGQVFISAESSESIERARQMVEYCAAEVEIGKTYKGRATRVTPFGVFVEVMPGKEGLVHISQLAEHHVKKVEDVVKEGDEVTVKVTDIDNQGRVVLSRKAALKI
ncbi:MAG: polyribonucleotide nucleotidyltransferase [Elusimicrobia bacterium CG_4_10_14_0_8_um_filter_37_32]|nr:MAG: polyribonucleotide nucleotidyltransferase [Elusimicrobia bacterium CG_4_10_14_0_8_um_filter_37_32]